MIETSVFYKIIGSFAALAAAGAWAFASILFRKLGEEISPFSMNFGKVIVGSLYLAVVLLIVGIDPVNMHAFLFLGISGIIGIAIGDTFFFMSLMQLGPRLASLMGILIPVSIVLSAVIFLGERPSFLSWVGIFLTVSGIGWVLLERMPQNKIVKNKSLGIKYSLLSLICMTVGVIFAKIGVASISALQATFIRIFWAVIVLTIWGGVSGQLKGWISPFKSPRLLKFLFITVFITVFGGFWLFLVALKYIDASIATILDSTTPLFILPMSVFILKEKISARAIIGVVVAVAGVILMFIR